VARPNWEYIRVDVLLPDNPKLDGLSATAKWTLIELWCHCGQRLSDGFVRDAAWKRYGTPTARRQIVERGLAKRVTGGYQMHDYLDHQRSLEQIQEMSAKRAAAGRRSAEVRAQARASVEHPVEQDAEQDAGNAETEILTGNTSSHPGTDPGSDRAVELSTGSKKPDKKTDGAGQPANGPQQDVEQTRSKPATEAEAEAEADRSRADVVDQSSVRNTRKSDDDEIDLIINEIHLATSRVVSPEHAAAVRSLLLNGRDVTDRGAYLRKIIRTERDPPARFLPLAAAHPSARPVSEANLAAGIAPNGTPLRGPGVTAAAAAARAAIHAPRGDLV
jgi:hypothetical protein